MNDPLALIGISLNNSWYTPKNIERVVREAFTEHGNARAFIVEAPQIHNYKAAYINEGSEEQHTHAKRSCYKQGQDSKKRVLQGIAPILDENPGADISIIHWAYNPGRSEKKQERVEILNPFAEGNAYEVMHFTLLSLYTKTHCKFKEFVDQTSAEVLEGRLDSEPSEKQVQIANGFLLDELALIGAAPDIFGRPVEYAYKGPFPILEALIDKVYGEKMPADLTFKVRA